MDFVDTTLRPQCWISRLIIYEIGLLHSSSFQENVGVLIQCDMSEGLVRRSKSASDSEVPTLRIIADEELVPFRDQCADLIVSSLSAHWINKLPQW